jgi:hypothetical protein
MPSFLFRMHLVETSVYEENLFTIGSLVLGPQKIQQLHFNYSFPKKFT